MILSKESIITRGLISKDMAADNCYESHSYALRTGIEYFDKEGRLTTVRPGDTISIPAFEWLIISAYEIIKLPSDISGRFGLKMKWANRGLFFTAGPQIKPLYDGILWGIIFNASGKDQAIVAGVSKLFDIEFHELQDTGAVPMSKVVPSLRSAMEQKLVDADIPTSGLARAVKQSAVAASKQYIAGVAALAVAISSLVIGVTVRLVIWVWDKL